MAENLSFHSVRLLGLGHNRTSKPVKVLILLLALLPAVAGYMTARTTFKVLSFFWVVAYSSNKHYIHWHCSQLHRCHYYHCQWCPEIHKELPVRSTGQDQKLGLVLDFPKTPSPCYYLKQDWYFPVPLHTQLYLNPAGPSGEAKSGFPANLFSGNHAWFFLERANAEGDFFFFHRRLLTDIFAVVRLVTLLSSLALLGVLAQSLQLTVIENES